MDVQVLFQAISTLGFPILCCIYMARYIDKTNEQHREEVGKLTEIIQNNTLALTKLTDKIENIENKVGTSLKEA